MQQLLAPGGLLVLVETTAPQRWLDLTFGLTAGWWKFADHDLRHSYPLLSAGQWRQLLQGNGFREAVTIPHEMEETRLLSQQAVIIGQVADKIPLNAAQKQLGILAQMGKDGSLAYNVSIGLELKGFLNQGAITQAIQTIVNRHEALRTVISNQNDFQEILPSLTVEVPLIDFSNLNSGDRKERSAKGDRNLQLADWFQKENQQPFDFNQKPLCRFSILKLESQLHLLVLTIHHIIVDGWSMGIILKELGALYSAQCLGADCYLKPSMQFKEYLQWQEQQSQTEAMAVHESYWLEQFAGSIPILDLPTDHSRPPIKTYKGSRQTMRLNPNLTSDVKRFSIDNHFGVYW